MIPPHEVSAPTSVPGQVDRAVSSPHAPREADLADQLSPRRYTHLGAIDLELGGHLDDVTVAYETYGQLNRAGDNAVIVCHALTGDAHLAGPTGEGQPTPGWWDELVGPGKAIDTNQWFVVCSNVLGGCQGTTGPSSLAPDGEPYGSRFPRVTIRDQVQAQAALADYLGITRIALVVGGSMGGMQALEWCAMHGDRIDAAWIGATSAFATADQIGLQTTQIRAILADPNWHDGDYAVRGTAPETGLGLARRIAHLSYRTESELAVRFARDHNAEENPLATSDINSAYSREHRYAVQSYLDHAADKLVRRFDAGSYVILSDAMTTHDVGRNRGGVATALSRIEVPMIVSGVDSDRLYPLRLQQQIVDSVPTAAPLRVIESPYGHDAFLLESEAVGNHIRQAFALAERARRSR